MHFGHSPTEEHWSGGMCGEYQVTWVHTTIQQNKVCWYIERGKSARGTEQHMVSLN